MTIFRGLPYFFMMRLRSFSAAALSAPVPARQREVFEQTGRPLVDNRPIVATGFVAKR